MGKRCKSDLNGKIMKSPKNKIQKKNININRKEISIFQSNITDQTLDTILSDSCIEDSRVESKRCFEVLIDPISSDHFFKKFLEKDLFLIRRNTKIFQKLFSTRAFDEILRNNIVKFTENLDVVRYVDDKRETLKEEGRASAPTVWRYFELGHSIRLLNPQTYSRPVWKVLSLLQEHFMCVAGANVYLTPAGTQGFAPHWDDIDAFVLQLEGRKRWKVYPPRTKAERLPRYSSENFTDKQIGNPMFEEILEPGDLLYFPRGYIHQACSLDDSHSLHITISVNQKNTWTDFLHNLLPLAIDMAAEEHVQFRRSLPHDYTTYIGAMHSELDSSLERPSDSDDSRLERNAGTKSEPSARTLRTEKRVRRSDFLETLRTLLGRVLDVLPVDAAADQMFKNYLATTLPPCLSTDETKNKMVSFLPDFLDVGKDSNEFDGVDGDGETTDGKVGIKRGIVTVDGKSGKKGRSSSVDGKNPAVIPSKGKRRSPYSLTAASSVKLIRANAVRVVAEEGIFLRHNLDNSRVYEGNESLPVELDEDEADCVESLIDAYPGYVRISELGLNTSEKNVEFAGRLAAKGFLLLKS